MVKKNKNNISREDIRHISYNFDKYLKIEAKKTKSYSKY